MLLVSYTLTTFTDFTVNIDIKTDVGYFLIAVICLNIIVNSIYILYFLKKEIGYKIKLIKFYLKKRKLANLPLFNSEARKDILTLALSDDSCTKDVSILLDKRVKIHNQRHISVMLDYSGYKLNHNIDEKNIS